MEINKVIIGSDHAGFEFKENLKSYLIERGFDLLDKGTYSEESTDYPEYAHYVAESVASEEGNLGVLICGSANGVCMTANKHRKIRAAIAWSSEIASLARMHNDANIICLPARFINFQEAKEILDSFFGSEFEGGRHTRRINKITLC